MHRYNLNWIALLFSNVRSHQINCFDFKTKQLVEQKYGFQPQNQADCELKCQIYHMITEYKTLFANDILPVDLEDSFLNKTLQFSVSLNSTWFKYSNSKLKTCKHYCKTDAKTTSLMPIVFDKFTNSKQTQISCL